MAETLLLRDARTASGADPVDVLLADGVVAAVGPDTVAAGARPGAREIALDGRWLLPGLWDEHVHFTQWALSRRRIDVSAAHTAGGAAALVAAHLGEHGAEVPPHPEHPLVGYGFRDGLWPDQPSVELLDRAAGALPVVLVSADLHCLWLNSAALGLYRSEVGDAPGGTDGTGLLVEDHAFAVTGRLAEVPDELVDQWAADAAAAAAARGVVGVVDLEMAWNAEIWGRRVAGGMRSLRVDTGIYPQHLDRALAEGLRTGDPVPGGAGLVTVGPLKILIDGSLNTRTACCAEPYPDGSTGLLTVQPDELLDVLRRAVGGGLVPAVHAIGDRANRIALDAFEALGSGGRIEHAQLVANADVPRFAALGVTASVQPEHAMDDRDVADRHWAGRTARAFLLRSLLDAGATLAFGSDAPVSPLDPWHAVAAAVARTRGDLPAWHPEQAIPVADALASSSRGRRRIRPGDPADVVAVDRDPWTAPAPELRAMPVALTTVAGAPTHLAPELRAMPVALTTVAGAPTHLAPELG
ncbi:amidohydrolase [Nakamurella endophytica]|uniref:Amidohydrolase n=1 Tax=Nakamurella endophytica TaxID=1748367 RepID=A0A917SWX4_9ACTN|nr:amidohydrolase family protein [Nakamurella endophytica]GGM00387.1 amidohydrolase [Nakamurella endophytica]